MAYTPGGMSISLATHEKTLSSKALSTLRVMAFLDPGCVHSSLFEPLRRLFTTKNEELNFDFPSTAASQTEACTELVEASLLHFDKKSTTYAMKPETQKNVMADLQKAGLISALFTGTVTVFHRIWPEMIAIPVRTVGKEEFKMATAFGLSYEEYVKKRYLDCRLSPCQEFANYAVRNIWGRRDELLHHLNRLERIFYSFNDAMIEVCATVQFAMLLVESSWYLFGRSRYRDAQKKIQSALGVYQLGKAKSSLHHASIYRVHAAIAFESGKFDEAAKYVSLQVELLELHHTAQGDALKESGLLDRALDAFSNSAWNHNVHIGIFVVLPFRTICTYGFRLYLSAQDEKDQLYTLSLHNAEICLSTALKDCQDAHIKTARMNSRIGELYYALANVANKKARYHGKAHLFNECQECYRKALVHFQKANDNHSAASKSKTHYKLATLFVHTQDYPSATHYIDEASRFYARDPAAYNPHLARLYFQQGRIQTLTGGSGAKSFMQRAWAIRVAIKPDEKRSAEELTEADFDELVGVWER